MGWIRILIDGYSVLHRCSDIAPDHPRHSAAARDELIQRLNRYQDASQTPVTIVFDGSHTAGKIAGEPSSSGLEVLYSPQGKTADDIIERATHGFLQYGKVLVVTDDCAEQSTVASLGGSVLTVRAFMLEMRATLDAFQDDLNRLNNRENRSFKRRESW